MPRSRSLSRRLAATLALLPLALTAASCGDDSGDGGDPDAIACSSIRPAMIRGGVGDVPGDFDAEAISGLISTTRIALDLGSVEITPAGSDTPETRPRLLTFQTNQPDADGDSLMTAIERRIESLGDEGRTFTVVDQDIQTYCDPSDGVICARFGLDDTENGVLVSDKIIHAATGGTITFTRLSSTVIVAEWDLQLGPNVQQAGFDTSSGALQGCFEALRGSNANGEEPLEAL